MIAGLQHLIAIDIDPERDREAWLESRLQGHGGSDVAKILNEHPEEGPIDVWLAHTTGVASDYADNERTRTGRFLEPYVLQWFAAGGDSWPRSGEDLCVVKPPTVYHRDRPWQMGSADGLGYYWEVLAHLGDELTGNLAGVDILGSSSRPNCIVEVKTHGWFGSRAYDIDSDGNHVIAIPSDKRIQCAWYMALYDIDVAYLAALVDTHLRRTFVIPRDRELEAMLLTEVEEFRRRYILTGEHPPPDGKASYSDYLRRRFKTHSAELVESTAQVDLAVAALLAVKREEKRLKAERELAEQVIKNAIGDHAGVRSANGIVTWKSQRSGKLRDKDARAELYGRLGMTDAEIAAFEAEYAQPDHRVLRTPTTK